MHTGHAKHMLIGGGLVLTALLLSGVSFGTALLYALLLACPVIMGGMVLMMIRGAEPHQPDRQPTPAEAIPRRPGQVDIRKGRSHATD